MSINTAKTFEADAWMRARPLHVNADGFALTGDPPRHLPLLPSGRSRGMVKNFNGKAGIVESFDGGRDVHFVASELCGTDFLNEGDIVDYNVGSIGVRNTATLVMVVYRA